MRGDVGGRPADDVQYYGDDRFKSVQSTSVRTSLKSSKNAVDAETDNMLLIYGNNHVDADLQTRGGGDAADASYLAGVMRNTRIGGIDIERSKACDINGPRRRTPDPTEATERRCRPADLRCSAATWREADAVQ